MKRIIIVPILSLYLAGCADHGVPEYNGATYNQIKQYEVGTVIDKRAVVISDDGSGGFFGSIIGAVIGSTIGRGSGSVLATLGGGIAGHYAGKELEKANADELTVKLDNGENVVVVVKGRFYQKGDRVKIIKDGNKVAQVERL
jgi:outer membrane lipoprotein SlyB